MRTHQAPRSRGGGLSHHHMHAAHGPLGLGLLTPLTWATRLSGRVLLFGNSPLENVASVIVGSQLLFPVGSQLLIPDRINPTTSFTNRILSLLSHLFFIVSSRRQWVRQKIEASRVIHRLELALWIQRQMEDSPVLRLQSATGFKMRQRLQVNDASLLQ